MRKDRGVLHQNIYVPFVANFLISKFYNIKCFWLKKKL